MPTDDLTLSGRGRFEEEVVRGWAYAFTFTLPVEELARLDDARGRFYNPYLEVDLSGLMSLGMAAMQGGATMPQDLDIPGLPAEFGGTRGRTTTSPQGGPPSTSREAGPPTGGPQGGPPGLQY
jgi:hypothetical protein